jgi:hypothetical protein
MKTFLCTFLFIQTILCIHQFDLKAQTFEWAKRMPVYLGYGISVDADGYSYITVGL